MEENSAETYFATSNLLVVTELLLKNINRNEENNNNLEEILWKRALNFAQEQQPEDDRTSLLQHNWQMCWTITRLLHILQGRSSDNNQALELDGALLSSRKEALFTCITNILELKPEDIKAIKEVFSKVLLSNLINKSKLLPKNDLVEEVLLKCLLHKPGEADLLLKLVSSNHEAFEEITNGFKSLYRAAVMQCLQQLSMTSDVSSKKKILNLLYALLLLMPCSDVSVSEKIGDQLYSLCESGDLVLQDLLTTVSFQQNSSIYSYLRRRENISKLRHIDCSSAIDIELVKNIFDIVTVNHKINIEELCFRVITSKRHWVEELIALAIHFVIVKDQKRLEALVSFPALWPALAINLWKLLSTQPDILDIVNPIIEKCQVIYNDLFDTLHKTLVRMKTVIDWLKCEGKTALPDINVMLSLTRNHSTLYVLQSTTHFVGLNHIRLENLLLDIEGPSSWNVQVFQGFKLLYSVFQILLKAVDIFNDSEIEEANEELIYLQYKEEINKPILELSKKLTEIEPLDFRLELLEDIFMLLFLRSEDFCEDKIFDESSPDENEDNLIQQVKCTSDSPLLIGSLPSPLHRKCSSPSRTISSASYPSSRQRKNSQTRRDSKSFPVKFSGGFICYPLLVNDILNLVKESLEDIDTTSDAVCHDRTIRLKNSVHDAIWRLNIVSELGQMEINSINVGLCKKTEKSWFYDDDYSSDSDSSPANTPVHASKAKRQRKGENASRSESSSNTTYGFKTNTSSSQVKKKSKLFKTSSNLINLMLASPSSLVSYFIASENMERALKAVERFNIKNCEVDVEMNFLKHLSHLREKLADVEIKNVDVSSSPRDYTIQAISETASLGALTAMLTKLIETFFVVTPLPEEVNESRGVVVLDLALSHPLSLQYSACLMDLATNYLNNESPNPVTGTLKSFTSSIASALKNAVGFGSLPEMLLDPATPLNMFHKIKDLNTFWLTMEECVGGFESSLMSEDEDLTDAMYLKLTTCSVTGQGFVQNYQDDTKQHFLNQLRSYLSCLWKVVADLIPTGTKYNILQNSLDRMIGELVFSKEKDPMDIESALHSLPISVVQLVVANCTPPIYIKQLKQKPVDIVLNEKPKNCQECTACHPQDVASFLMELTECIDLHKSDDLHSLTQDPNIKRVLSATHSLQSLDWNQIQGDQLFAFLVNLYNLIWLHALIALEITDQYGLLSPSAYLRDLSAKSVGYIVGGNCFISLAELHDMITPTPASVISSDVSNKKLPVAISSDPRALFVLANPFTMSPTIKVLSHSDIDQELDERAFEFIETSVVIEREVVILPMILFYYTDYMTLTQGTEGDTDNSSKDHVTGFARDFLKDHTEKDIIFKEDIGFNLIKTNSSEIKNDASENVSSWKSKEIRPEVLKYLASRNPLLGTIVEKIHCIESADETVKTPAAITALERKLLSEETNSLAALYDNNVMLVVLQPDLDYNKLWSWFDTCVLEKDWLACLEMLRSIPEKQLKTDPRLTKFRDWVLEQLSSTCDGWLYCQCIEDPCKMYYLIMANLDKWSLRGSITMFHILLSMNTSALPDNVIVKAKQLESSIETTRRVKKECTVGSIDDAWTVVEELIRCDKINLALQWFHHSDLIHVEHSSYALLLIGQLVLELLEKGQDVDALELLNLLPIDEAVRISENIVAKAQTISSLQQIVHFLQSQKATPAQALRYEYLDIGVHMLSYIPSQEQESYRALVSQPELLIEQLLMSTRISTLETILQNLQGRITNLPPGSPLSTQCLDAFLRRYASKAVDVRVRTKMLPLRRTLTPEVSSKFTPPAAPPLKEEWVANDEVTECMCCEVTTFSMFNRRHHCRRCGRVICNVCSLHRFKVAGYGNVKVRICNDCYDYILPKITHPDMSSDGRSVWNETNDSEPEWRLTEDLVYNATVREEFTYTHAPSISLCLSILKLHSEHSSLFRFLFTTIEGMLQLLRPLSPGTINPEVDYSLLVTMIRSLLEFAKLSCSQHGSTSDWATVDSLFAEVDLLGMLVSSPQTCRLVPTEPLRGQSALAALRENLLKSELWTLALEVSTKAGLDYNSVWLAWGKACLKAGAWIDARDKFSHCSPHKNDAQLLQDILQILQDSPQITALKSRLSRLKVLSSRPDALHTSHSLEPRVYEECLYYLRTYGNYASTLTFYFNQNDMKSAVLLLVESAVETQTYLDNLFLPALQSARVTQLYTSMSEFDKSLIVFKEYLRASCAYCERHNLYHVLYQAQIWMNDHIRAAMTCIHFFKHNARSYQDLATSKVHLETALGHLQSALKSIKDSKNPLVMHLSKDGVVRYISTIRLQLEVIESMMAGAPEVPPLTLFGSPSQRVNLASTIISVGGDIEKSFTLAAKVAKDWQVDKSAILCTAASQLVKEGKVCDVQKLAALVEVETELYNQILIAALKEKPSQQDAELLMPLLTDVASKITILINYGQLKTAYLLAVKYDRLSDIHRVLEAAIEMDQPLIRKICRKRLNLSDEDYQSSTE